MTRASRTFCFDDTDSHPNSYNDVVFGPRTTTSSIAVQLVLCLERRRGGRLQYHHTYSYWSRGEASILKEQGKPRHPARIPLRRHLTFPGLYPPHSLSQRQHPRVHCPPTTKTTTILPSLILLLFLGPRESSLFPSSSLAPRILPGRCPQHLCQSRSLRRRLSPKAIIPRPSTTHNHSPFFLHRALCVRYTSLRNLQPAGAAAELGMVVW